MYKILLTGRNMSVINDFFDQLMNTFDPMTSSTRYDDLLIHLKYFSPDAFAYCLNKEPVDDISRITNLMPKLKQDNIPLVILGDAVDCDEFNRQAPRYADLTLTKPLTPAIIEEKLEAFLKQLGKDPNSSSQMFSRPAAATPKSTVPTFSNITPLNADGSAPSAAAAAPAAEKAPKRKHILIVDDDYRILKIVKDHLHDKYDIATAPNGILARRFLKAKTTDLILLDYQMPDEDGPAVLSQLRKDPLTMYIPVIFLTGVTDRQKIAKALVLKPQGYLLKPIDRNKLLEMIAKVLGES